MRKITLEELLEAGCHFGHQITRSNPKARDFIFEAREGVHIIDLGKTKEGLEEAGSFVKSIGGKEGSSIVVVGTKRQARGIIEEEAKKALRELQGKQEDPGLYFVTNRWIGGLLTNFSEVSKNFKKLIDLMANLNNPAEREKYTKKEVGMWEKEKVKLESLYGGVFKIQKTPDLLFIVDSHLEDLAVREAQKMGVYTVAIVDTNADPQAVDYPIPANDDAVGSIELIVKYIMESWVEGKKSAKPEKPEEEKASQKTEKKTEAKEKPVKSKAEGLKKETKKEVKPKKEKVKEDKKDVKSKSRTSKKTS